MPALTNVQPIAEMPGDGLPLSTNLSVAAKDIVVAGPGVWRVPLVIHTNGRVNIALQPEAEPVLVQAW
jgi:hypothetical protein